MKLFAKLLHYSCLLIVVLCFTILGIPSFSQDSDYTLNFSWEKNHTNDNVDHYRLWFKPDGNEFDDTYIDDWPEIEGGATEFYSFSPADLNHVPDNFCEADSLDTVIFALTAVDVDGFESDKSNEISVQVPSGEFKLDCGDGDEDGGGGGGGGGCFLTAILNYNF